MNIDLQTTDNLDLAMRQLAMESNSVFDVITSFTKTLSPLTTKLTDLITSIPSSITGESKSDIRRVYGDIDDKLKVVKFIDYRKTLVSVPEGFRGHILPYAKIIAKHNLTIYQDAIAKVKTYNSMLADFITNKDSKISLKDETRFFMEIDRDMQAIKKEIYAYFPNDNNSSKAMLSDVIQRFMDVEELVHDIEGINRHFASKNLETFKDVVSQSVEMLNMVIDGISNGSIRTVSGNAARNVSEGAYEIAKFAEFISMFRFKTIELTSTGTNLVIQLDEILK
jgi:hypothetical protein